MIPFRPHPGAVMSLSGDVVSKILSAFRNNGGCRVINRARDDGDTTRTARSPIESYCSFGTLSTDNTRRLRNSISIVSKTNTRELCVCLFFFLQLATINREWHQKPVNVSLALFQRRSVRGRILQARFFSRV